MFHIIGQLIIGGIVGVLIKHFWPSEAASPKTENGWLLAGGIGTAGGFIGTFVARTLWADNALVAQLVLCVLAAAIVTLPFRKHLGRPGELREVQRTIDSPSLKASRLATYGAILAIVSIAITAWGHSYTSRFSNTASAALGNLMGQPDTTYQLAQNCVVFGGIGALVGVVLFIVGLAQR